MTAAAVAATFTVTGAVQGVGFRPFVHRLATGLGLAGSVANTGVGVRIEVEGSADAVAAFREHLRSEAPAHARVDHVGEAELAPSGRAGFAIASADIGVGVTAEPMVDVAVCRDCLADIADPRNRRYRHPFASCAICGPRYSIVRSMPWQRSGTSMAGFPLCPACAAEFADPADRRFHAETIACHDCGPRLTLVDTAGREIAGCTMALDNAVTALANGHIVAVKGIGGYHLMVRADDEGAVERLRERKHRPAKPFAVMFRDIGNVEAAAALSPAERALLTDRAAPVVLLEHRHGRSPVADAVAPGNPRLGAMLAYTPLHHLLLEDLGVPLVATSANASGDLTVHDDAEALARLSGIADLFLVHDRAVVRPLEDSVVQVVDGRPMLLRRSRGHAPAPVRLPAALPPLVAYGGQLKSVVAVARGDRAVMSGHLGDLDGAAGAEAFAAATRDLEILHGASPQAVACDLHPDYHSTFAAENGGPAVIRVQHHLAHVAAAMAEHALEPPVLGVAWDGTGLGPDGNVWGGEILLVERGRWRRMAHLHPFRLPGGEAAIRQPRLAALGILAEAAPGLLDDASLPPLRSLGDRAALARRGLAAGVNAPWTTSAGRLIEAVASLLDLGHVDSFEGEAAIALEHAARRARAPGTPYPFDVISREPLAIDWRPAIRALLDDTRAGRLAGECAARFHAGLIKGMVAAVARFPVRPVVLTGGCFQSPRLTHLAAAALAAAGFTASRPERVPPNDGGLALGQLWWAGHLAKGADPCASPSPDA